MPATTAQATPAAATASLRWSLLFGNFAIGVGVMAATGTLNDLTRDLAVSVAVGGQLVTVAAVLMAVGAPLLAAAFGSLDRRRLLAAALAWFALGHALAAMAPNFGTLLLVRSVTVLGAAVFTPQAAAAMAAITPAAQRGRAITFIFLGWSIASVLGMPLSAWLAEHFGWRSAFWMAALASGVGAAWVWRAMPNGVRPPVLSMADWHRVLTHPALMVTVAVTAFSSAGQFTLFAYLAPYYRQGLGFSANQISLLFFWFGLIGVGVNVLLSRHIDRIGAGRAVSVLLAVMALGLLLWPLGQSLLGMALVLVPWAMGCFSSNSGQQARLGGAAPLMASALIALNSSAMYVGQALGAAGGGMLIAHSGFDWLHLVGFAWLLLALAGSVWASRRMAAPALSSARA